MGRAVPTLLTCERLLSRHGRVIPISIAHRRSLLPLCVLHSSSDLETAMLITCAALYKDSAVYFCWRLQLWFEARSTRYHCKQISDEVRGRPVQQRSSCLVCSIYLFSDALINEATTGVGLSAVAIYPPISSALGKRDACERIAATADIQA